MNRKAIRDLAAKELGLKTAKYFYAKTLDELKEHSKEIGFPCVIKPLMSSSGHGQSIVKSADELETAFNAAMEGSRGDVKEIIIEEFIHFDSEFTLLTVTQKDGPTLFCPPIGHVQKSGDYRESWQPFALSEADLKEAQHMAEAVTKALTGAGIWGVEFFLSRDKGVKRITRENGMLLVHSDRDCHTAVITALLTNGYDMRRLRQRGGDLDEIYSKYFEMAGEQYEGYTDKRKTFRDGIRSAVKAKIGKR